jgi:hypothetical protein
MVMRTLPPEQWTGINDHQEVRMRYLCIGYGVGVILMGLLMGAPSWSQDIAKEECFYLKSLHYTANGMDYWYSKERGGLESLTGIPYDQLSCKNCHAPGCDRCHKVKETANDCEYAYYATDQAANQALCLTCHGREKAMIRVDHSAGQEDVHIKQEMICTDCHSQREMHGDGNSYLSLKQPGAMDTACENCHDDIKPTESHTVHGDRLDCKACHVRHVVSCTNCHFDTLVEKGVRKAIPVSGWMFLMNYRNKVTSASMQTFVTGKNKTFLMFAPHMSHSIMPKGRACDGCHGIRNAKQVKNGKLELTWLENKKVVNRKGVIPVVDGVEYDCVYQHFVDGKWVPVDKPLKPMVQYAAFGKPLTVQQLEKMVADQVAPPLKME